MRRGAIHNRTTAIWVLAAAALVMSGPGARAAATYTGGAGNSFAMGAMTNDSRLGGPAVTLSSAADQSFFRGYAPVTISALTIADDPVTPGISNGTPITVRIPAGLGMTWDETNLTATLAGTAANKVNPTVSYAGASRWMIIAVTNNFAAGDTLVVSALAYKHRLGYGSLPLELDYDSDGLVDAYDDKTITIFSFFTYGALGDSYALDRMFTDKILDYAGTRLSIH